MHGGSTKFLVGITLKLHQPINPMITIIVTDMNKTIIFNPIIIIILGDGRLDNTIA